MQYGGHNIQLGLNTYQGQCFLSEYIYNLIKKRKKWPIQLYSCVLGPECSLTATPEVYLIFTTQLCSC